MEEIHKVCHNCKGKGIVDGGFSKREHSKHETAKLSKCGYCHGKGYMIYWDI